MFSFDDYSPFNDTSVQSAGENVDLGASFEAYGLQLASII